MPVPTNPPEPSLSRARAAAAAVALAPPASQLAWQALVEVGDKALLGKAPLGQRWMIPITGGVFWGAGEFIDFAGKVLPGGADRQLHRSDGVRELDALYEMQTEAGDILTVRNRVLIDDAAPEGRYALSQLRVIAPQGRWAVLNRRVFVGTLHPMPQTPGTVLIRVYLLT